jgi:hypothetical protein
MYVGRALFTLPLTPTRSRFRDFLHRKSTLLLVPSRTTCTASVPSALFPSSLFPTRSGPPLWFLGAVTYAAS